MEGVLRMIGHGEGVKTGLTEEQKGILEEIKEVNREMACIDRWFQLECNEDLIESCIYQREALNARYRYLISRAKDAGLSASPFKDVV